MRIKSIAINSLRCHKKSDVEFSDNLNIIHGLNGSGKTSILEAIAICSISKSFLPTKDVNLIKFGDVKYTVNLLSYNELGSKYEISIEYNKLSKKLIKSTYGDNLIPKDIIGEIPIVILTPDYKTITFGSPSDRRSFIDRLLSQINKSYMSNLISLKKCLKQRNQILLDSKKSRTQDFSLINPWTEELIKISSDIISKRNEFIKEFRAYFLEYYKLVSGGKEIVDIQYRPDGIEGEIESFSKEQIIKELKYLFDNSIDEEIMRGTTKYGPQKDELDIFINSSIAKETASQGQHKSLLIALKFAEFYYLLDKKKETPIVLFDDIFSELDIRRKELTLEMIIKNRAQTFITTTNRNEIDISKVTANVNYIFVNNGVVYLEK